MFYKILKNEKSLGIFGHSDINNIHLSVSGGPDDMYVFASGVCIENGKQVHYDWIQEAIKDEDKIEIVKTSQTNASEPRKRFVMDRVEREASEDIICDFCQRNETKVARMIHVDEHRPNICSDCVSLCNEILKKQV